MTDKKDIKPITNISSIIPKNLNNVNLYSTLGLSSKLGSPSSRLPSFKGPRDLTLSAGSESHNPQIVRPRKTFTPNIPARREKGDRVIESKSEKSQKRSPVKTKQQQGRGKFIKKEKEFIQTQGSLFGEGIVAAPIKRPSYGGGFTGGRGSRKLEHGLFMQKPVLNPDAAYNVDKDLEEKKLRELLRDDFIDDPNEESTDQYPIRLPMIGTSKVFKQEADDKDVIKKSKLKLEDTSHSGFSDIRVKEEPVDIDDNDSNSPDALENKIDTIKLKDETNPMPCDKQSELLVSEVLSEANTDVMLFQLPSCLPGHPPAFKQELGPQSTAQNSQSKLNATTTEKEKSTAPERCTLSTLPEGQLGTLKIYESGKAELWLGNHKLTINKGTQVGFLQDLVNVNTDKDLKTGSLSVLGHIKHRLVCTPDFETMSQSSANPSYS